MEKQETWKPVVGYEGFYEVSDLGRVRSLNYRRTGKEGLMKPSPAKMGSYLQVSLYKNGKQETCKVHQLVMRAFVGECPDGYEVDHYDWNPENNKLENLSYQPKELNRGRHSPEGQQNISEAAKKLVKDPEWLGKAREGAKKRAEDPEWRKNQAEAMRKLHKDPEWLRKNAEAVRKANSKPVDQFTFDGEYVKTWASIAEAAREVGIDNSVIGKCCNGKCKSAKGFKWKFV